MTSTTRRRLLRAAGAAMALPLLPRAAAAQSWPTRPIRAMIPFSAGSTIARAVRYHVEKK